MYYESFPLSNETTKVFVAIVASLYMHIIYRTEMKIYCMCLDVEETTVDWVLKHHNMMKSLSATSPNLTS